MKFNPGAGLLLVLTICLFAPAQAIAAGQLAGYGASFKVMPVASGHIEIAVKRRGFCKSLR